MENNEELQKHVQDAIKWEPLLNAAEIGVTVKNGVVTLTGTVDSYAKKLEAEDAAKRVAGVKAVVEKIAVEFGSMAIHNDAAIASEVVEAFKWSWNVPGDRLTVKVEQGWVTLGGAVQWNYQKEAAKEAIKNLAGVKGVTNEIRIKSNAHDTLEKMDIEQALLRNWSIDERDIQVKVTGSNITLYGKVGSIYQRDEVARIAWNAPGVQTVDNELTVDYSLHMAC
ncbi:MAG: BON domain-containing protein [Rudanella sp.]|nr:BON domain-containing protein [Rudanella sp.]